MGKRVSIKDMRKEAPDWVFSWRRPDKPRLIKWFAVLVTAGLFALLVTVVRVHVSPPAKWAAPKATVIHVGGDAAGRALRQRAREGGPFPSRFQPSEWEGAAELEQAVLAAARWTPPPYQPVLRDLPDDVPAPLRLAARGERFLPKRQPAPADSTPSVKLSLVPMIYPLSGIRADQIPAELPALDGEVAADITAEFWRFLVRLDAAGHVRDYVSLAGNADVDLSPLENWLRRVSFHPEPGNSSRWVAVSVGFINQPAADEPDAR